MVDDDRARLPAAKGRQHDGGRAYAGEPRAPHPGALHACVHPLVDAQLSETLDHLAHEEDENPRLDADQHAQHKRELAEQAALLEGKLEQLVIAADGGEEGASASDVRGRYRMAKYELSRMHEAVAMSRLFSDEHRHLVFKNLHAM